MNEIKISIPAGHEIDLEQSNLSKGIVRFKAVNTVYTFRDILENENGTTGWMIASDGLVDDSRLSSMENEDYYVDARTEADAKKALAFIKYLRVASYYNEHYSEGVKLNWTDGNWNKWYIYYDHEAKVYAITNGCGGEMAPVYFSTKKLATMMVEHNRDILDEFYEVGK